MLFDSIFVALPESCRPLIVFPRPHFFSAVVTYSIFSGLSYAPNSPLYESRPWHTTIPPSLRRTFVIPTPSSESSGGAIVRNVDQAFDGPTFCGSHA